MRLPAAVLLAVVAGTGLGLVLLGGDGGPPRDDAGDPAGPGDGLDPDERYYLLRTGSLMVRAQAADGSVPPGTEVGYRHQGRLRLRYAGPDGVRHFADAALGDLEVVAIAPGYREASQRRRLLAGVPLEVLLTLEPLTD